MFASKNASAPKENSPAPDAFDSSPRLTIIAFLLKGDSQDKYSQQRRRIASAVFAAL